MCNAAPSTAAVTGSKSRVERTRAGRQVCAPQQEGELAMAKIAVIGCGYVGLGTGAVFADLGNQVVGVEIDAARVETLRAGECPIFEPGLEELLARNLKAGR